AADEDLTSLVPRAAQHVDQVRHLLDRQGLLDLQAALEIVANEAAGRRRVRGLLLDALCRRFFRRHLAHRRQATVIRHPQYAPLLRTTAGMVFARMTRSSHRDQLSMY